VYFVVFSPYFSLTNANKPTQNRSSTSLPNPVGVDATNWDGTQGARHGRDSWAMESNTVGVFVVGVSDAIVVSFLLIRTLPTYAVIGRLMAAQNDVQCIV
jgi:hypothetical protein